MCRPRGWRRQAKIRGEHMRTCLKAHMDTCKQTKSRNKMTKNIRHCLKIKNSSNSTLFQCLNVYYSVPQLFVQTAIFGVPQLFIYFLVLVFTNSKVFGEYGFAHFSRKHESSYDTLLWSERELSFFLATPYF